MVTERRQVVDDQGHGLGAQPSTLVIVVDGDVDAGMAVLGIAFLIKLHHPDDGAADLDQKHGGVRIGISEGHHLIDVLVALGSPPSANAVTGEHVDHGTAVLGSTRSEVDSLTPQRPRRIAHGFDGSEGGGCEPGVTETAGSLSSMELSDGPTGISVTGIGSVTVEPEIATLRVGVSLDDKSLERVRSEAAVKISAARRHLLDSGVAESDITTSRLSVHNYFDRQVKRRTYHLSTRLDVIIRDLGSAESIANDLFATIGDGMEMQGITFGVEDDQAWRRQAVELAFADAKSKAEHLAALAEVTLGAVVSMNESAPDMFAARPAMRSMAAAGAAADIPIEAGELDQTATVHVRWSIDQ